MAMTGVRLKTSVQQACITRSMPDHVSKLIPPDSPKTKEIWVLDKWVEFGLAKLTVTDSADV